MLGACDVVGFVATADMDRACRFYGKALGLTMVEEDAYASVFDANGTQVRVTIVEEVSPRPYTILGWAVADIAESIRQLSERGVAFVRYKGMEQDDLGVWRSPGGAQIAWFKDPDGNTLSLTQFQHGPSAS